VVRGLWIPSILCLSAAAGGQFPILAASLPLRIDPVLGSVQVFGTQRDPIQAIATDAAGNVYVAGTATQAIPLMNPIAGQSSVNCPSTSSVPSNNCPQIFVAKFDPSGTQLLYSTYLGGDQPAVAAGLVVDRAGNAYVAGTAGANVPQNGQAFVVKLNASGSAILYRVQLTGSTVAHGVAVDAQGESYLTGVSLADDFPAVRALQAQPPLRSLLVTHDGGTTWNSLNQNLPAPGVNWLAIDPTNTATLYAATSIGLYKSSDSGVSWMQILAAGKAVRQVVLAPSAPTTLYAVYGDIVNTPNQLAKSVDGGANWQILTSAIPPPVLSQVLYIGSLAIDPSNASTLWMSTSVSVLQSMDGGAQWSDEADFVHSLTLGDSILPEAGGVIVDPANPARVYVCCGFSPGLAPGSVFRTEDGGKTWTEGQNSGAAGLGPPVLDPRNSSVLYDTWRNGVAHSGDAGQSWDTLTLPAGAPTSETGNAGYTSLKIDASGALYVLNGGGVLLRSADGGATWTSIQGPWDSLAQLLAIDPANVATMYVGNPAPLVPAQGYEHAFLTKLDARGAVKWATLLAGSQRNEAHAVALDTAGNAYVGGRTNSPDFPVANANQSTRRVPSQAGHDYDGFLPKISADGSSLVYGTYLGGSLNDTVNGIAVDGAGNVYMAGETDSTDFPTTDASQAGRLGTSSSRKSTRTGRSWRSPPISAVPAQPRPSP